AGHSVRGYGVLGLYQLLSCEIGRQAGEETLLSRTEGRDEVVENRLLEAGKGLIRLDARIEDLFQLGLELYFLARVFRRLDAGASLGRQLIREHQAFEACGRLTVGQLRLTEVVQALQGQLLLFVAVGVE